MSARVLVAVSLLATLALSQILAGCGQTGPLHMPADAPAGEGYLIGSNPNVKKKADAKPAAAPPAAATPAATPADAAPASTTP
ncbi:LPS translocon maturation chaperone LptM [Nevskia ramosa]|uniref:LPS translocon maturation chaperone LptM n=1 Tax=Nevskia ramosa TaxID=64002 RepID=UPI0012EB92AB